MTADASDTALKRVARSLGVLAMFGVVGPAAGGLLVFCCVYPLLLLLGFDMAETTPSTPSATQPVALLSSVSLFLAAGYAFGGVQALLAGAFSAVVLWRKGSLSNWAVIAGTVLATAAWLAVLYSPLNPIASGDAGDADKISAATRIAVALLPVGLVSAVLCRWLCAKAGLIGDRR